MLLSVVLCMSRCGMVQLHNVINCREGRVKRGVAVGKPIALRLSHGKLYRALYLMHIRY